MYETHVTQHQQTEYQPSLWAVLLHQLPHVNITFHRLEDERFRPDSELYLESLGIIGSVPAAILIVTLIILLIYLLTRCCDTKNNKKRKSRPIRCCLSFFALVCCSALAVGFYGNHELHAGLERFSQSMVHMDRLIVTAQKQVKSFNDALTKEVEHNLNTLYDGTFQTEIGQDKAAHYELMEKSEFIFYNVSDGLKAMDKIRLRIYDPQLPINIKNVPSSIQNVEKLRWPVTMGLLGVFSLFCIILFMGAICHSRATLIIFSVCGLFSVILLWLLASVYVTSAVAMADFCYKPTPWVKLALERSFNLSEDISNYYLKCNDNEARKMNPFEKPLQDSQRTVMDIGESVKRVNLLARQHYRENQLYPALSKLMEASETTVTLMGDLNNSLKCDSLFRFYNDALNAACGEGLFGLFVMLVSAIISALFFTILVWCNSHTWIYFKHKAKYVKVEDQDPYMPLSTIDRGGRGGSMGMGSMGSMGAPIYQRSRTIHTPPQTPPYHGTLNGHGTMGGHGPMATLPGQKPNGMMMDNKPLPGPPQLHAGIGYGHIGTLNRGVGMGPQGFMNPGVGAGTLGRHPQQKPANPTYSTYGNNGAAATMTLGRRGHYASLRSAAARTTDVDLPLLGPNQGQYATLSKGCKTLESSDFY